MDLEQLHARGELAQHRANILHSRLPDAGCVVGAGVLLAFRYYTKQAARIDAEIQATELVEAWDSRTLGDPYVPPID